MSHDYCEDKTHIHDNHTRKHCSDHFEVLAHEKHHTDGNSHFKKHRSLFPYESFKLWGAVVDLQV